MSFVYREREREIFAKSGFTEYSVLLCLEIDRKNYYDSKIFNYFIVICFCSFIITYYVLYFNYSKNVPSIRRLKYLYFSYNLKSCIQVD